MVIRVTLPSVWPNLANRYIELGELAAVERDMRRCIQLLREIENELDEAIGHQKRGRLLVYQGMFEAADVELSMSTHYWEQINDKQGLCLDESYRALWRALYERCAPRAGGGQSGA